MPIALFSAPGIGSARFAWLAERALGADFSISTAVYASAFPGPDAELQVAASRGPKHAHAHNDGDPLEAQHAIADTVGNAETHLRGLYFPIEPAAGMGAIDIVQTTDMAVTKTWSDLDLNCPNLHVIVAYGDPGRACRFAMREFGLDREAAELLWLTTYARLLCTVPPDRCLMMSVDRLHVGDWSSLQVLRDALGLSPADVVWAALRDYYVGLCRQRVGLERGQVFGPMDLAADIKLAWQLLDDASIAGSPGTDLGPCILSMVNVRMLAIVQRDAQRLGSETERSTGYAGVTSLTSAEDQSGEHPTGTVPSGTRTSAAMKDDLRVSAEALSVRDDDLKRARASYARLRAAALNCVTELDAIKNSRWWRMRLMRAARIDLTSSVSPEFAQLVDDGLLVGLRPNGAILGVGRNLDELPFQEYPFAPTQPMRLCGLHVAVSIDLLDTTFALGVEVVAPDETIAGHFISPEIGDNDLTRPVHFRFEPLSIAAGERWRLRIFVRDATGPVRAYEYQRPRYIQRWRVDRFVFCGVDLA